MELVRKQNLRGRARYLLLTDPDLKTGIARAVIADAQAGTVKRARDAAPLLLSAAWLPLTTSDPSLDDVVRQIPALRRHRGIEIRLPSGITAWILWRQWTSADTAAQAQLAALTAGVAVPAFEPDGDWFLADYAAKVLGGNVLDPPRSALNLGGAY